MIHWTATLEDSALLTTQGVGNGDVLTSTQRRKVSNGHASGKTEVSPWSELVKVELQNGMVQDVSNS